MRVFIDTCIPMYAAGRDHPLKVSCIEILLTVAQGKLEAYTDTEVFQEILHRYLSLNRRPDGLKIFSLFSEIMYGFVLPVNHQDMLQVAKLAKDNSLRHLSSRDLVHLAVMLNNGIERIITADRGFLQVPGIQVTLLQ